MFETKRAVFHTGRHRFTLQTSRSSGGWTRTFTRLLNREPPYHWATPDCCLIKSGWLDLNQRSRVSGSTRSARLSHILICKMPSGSRTHTSAMARQQATATSWAQNCITTKLSKIKNQEHRAGIEPASPRYDGGVLPLDHQCLCRFSGTGENRTHIVRFKRPMHYLVCHNPMCVLSCPIGVEGIEPSTLVL